MLCLGLTGKQEYDSVCIHTQTAQGYKYWSSRSSQSHPHFREQHFYCETVKQEHQAALQLHQQLSPLSTQHVTPNLSTPQRSLLKQNHRCTTKKSTTILIIWSDSSYFFVSGLARFLKKCSQRLMSIQPQKCTERSFSLAQP